MFICWKLCYGGAIFSQGILITNNCTFLNNNAYSNGLDICIGDGGILVMDNKNITSANATGAVCFAKSLTGTASTWIKVGSYVASFVVGFGIGYVTVNPYIGMAAGAGVGALIGSLASSYIISKTYDANFNRVKLCAILIWGSAAAGALGGLAGSYTKYSLDMANTRTVDAKPYNGPNDMNSGYNGPSNDSF